MIRIKTPSLLRRLEYKALSTLSIDGRILDIGGAKRSGYHELLGGVHEITTANIDAEYGIDIIFDAQESWPAEDATYEAVLLINVLEHLYHYKVAISEAYRALVPNGRVVGVVPFLLNIHGTPSDHFRFTSYTLEREFMEAGYTSITIQPLGTGAFSVTYQLFIAFVRWNWLADILIVIATGLDRLVKKIFPNSKLDVAHMPLGYYFVAHK